MSTLVEAVYENGVLKPLDNRALKEHARYLVIVEEIAQHTTLADPVLVAELARRTTVHADGRQFVRLGGIFEQLMGVVQANADPVAEALDDLRRERAKQFDAEWPMANEEAP